MSKKSDERIVFDEEKEARFARFLRENEYLIAHIDCLLLHKFLKLMCMGRDESGPYTPPGPGFARPAFLTHAKKGQAEREIHFSGAK